MSAKYVSQKPERALNAPAPEVVRAERIMAETFAKASALRNLPPQTAQNYGKKCCY
jgi:hypothetical protein